jgi:hypothetical protein
VYEKNGEKYFVVDSHMHYWNAAPDNWVPGQEQFAKGWIECFHAYQGLAPPETHWPIEKFQKYSEDDLMKDVFDDGHVDVAIFQPTSLLQWYRDGFNTTEQDAVLFEKYPGKFILNTNWDPRAGEDGLVDATVGEDVLLEVVDRVFLELLEAPVRLRRAETLVGVEALDPALGVLLLSLDPVLRTGVPEVEMAVEDEVLLAVLLVHSGPPTERA